MAAAVIWSIIAVIFVIGLTIYITNKAYSKRWEDDPDTREFE